MVGGVRFPTDDTLFLSFILHRGELPFSHFLLIVWWIQHFWHVGAQLE
jgi:hypothetical protein